MYPMRIGVLTGGGDCPGLNAVIRAVVSTCDTRYGSQVVGFQDGWNGLLENRRIQLVNDDRNARLLAKGGTMLGSSRTNPLVIDDGLAIVERNLDAHGIDALVAIGGDDTLSVAARLAEHGANVVGLPKTVDFDLAVTEYCIGFDSAVAIVTESLDRLHTTAASHHRVMVCEVMGRDTGWLAVMGGIAGGADLCLIPEFPLHLDEVVAQIARRDAEGKTSSIVVVAEGAEIGGLIAEADGPTDAFGHVNLARRALAERLADAIESATSHDTRATVLGHVQRGGSPVARDRIWPSRLGVAAVDAIRSGVSGVCAAVVGDQACLVPLADMVAEQKRVPESLYRVFTDLS